MYCHEKSTDRPYSHKSYIIKKFIFLVTVCVLPGFLSFAEKKLTYESEIFVTAQETEIAPVKTETAMEDLVAYHFEGDDAKIARAIIKAESSGNPKAVGYNCYYTKNGTVHETRVQGAYSTFCKKGHEKYAWSVDCGKVQRNFPGRKTCPEYAFDPEWSVAEMKRLHNERGWKPWVTYTSGKYMAYMEN